MLIYLHGDDSYRRQKKVNYYVEEYKKRYADLFCDFFDFEFLFGQEEFFRLKEFFSQQTLFGGKKMAVLSNVFEVGTEELKDFFKKHINSEDFTILISEKKLPPKELDFIAKKSFKVEEFEELRGSKLLFFLQKEIQEKKIILTSKALSFLVENYKNNSWGLINELEKISLMDLKKIIDIEDLKKIGDYGYEQSDIFGYINAVSRNWSLARRIVALEKLFISQEEPFKVFNIFASLNYLPKNFVKRMADYDAMVKSGGIDYDEILVDLALTQG